MGWVGFGRWDRGQESTAECRIARRSTVVLLACWCMTPASILSVWRFFSRLVRAGRAYSQFTHYECVLDIGTARHTSHRKVRMRAAAPERRTTDSDGRRGGRRAQAAGNKKKKAQSSRHVTIINNEKERNITFTRRYSTRQRSKSTALAGRPAAGACARDLR